MDTGNPVSMVRVGMSLASPPRSSSARHGGMAWSTPRGAAAPQTPRALISAKKYYGVRVPNHAAAIPKTSAFSSGRSSSTSPAFTACSSRRSRRREVGLGAVAGALGAMVIERPVTAFADQDWGERPASKGSPYRVGQLRAKTTFKAAMGTADDAARLRRLQQVVDGRALVDTDYVINTEAQRQARNLSLRLGAGAARPQSSMEKKRPMLDSGVGALEAERPATAPADADGAGHVDLCVGSGEEAPVEASATVVEDAEGRKDKGLDKNDGGAGAAQEAGEARDMVNSPATVEEVSGE